MASSISLLAIANLLSFASAEKVNPAQAVITPRAKLPILRRQASSSTAGTSTIDNPYLSWIGYYQNPSETDTYTWSYCPDSNVFTTSVYQSTTLVGCCYSDSTTNYCTTDLALTCSDNAAWYPDTVTGKSTSLKW